MENNMLSKESLSFLERLLNTASPSGFELETAALYHKHLKGFCHHVYNDVIGNTIGVLNEKAKFKVMLAGHYDEIGFQVVCVSDEGLIHFRKVGGIDQATLPGTEIEILTRNGKIPGVIGKKPIHLTESKERDKILEIKDLMIDIGAENKREASGLVDIGDPITIKPNFTLFGKHRIKSKGLDNKIGAFVIAEATKILSTSKNLKVGVYCVGTVQEELGYRGAKASAHRINPNVGIALDVTFATDTPDIPKKELGDIKLGKGPTLTRCANENWILGKKIREIAKKKNIPYQEEVGHRASGGTDADIIQLSNSGVATCILSIPNRYMHTPVEICDLRDVENAIKILVELIPCLKETDSFVPKF